MKLTNTLFLFTALVTGCASIGHKSTSPDGKIVPRVFLDEQNNLTYSLAKSDTSIMLPSKMGIKIDGVDLGKGVNIEEISTEKVSDQFEWLGTSATVPNNYLSKQYEVTHLNSGKKWLLDTRTYDTGFAFRYVVEGKGRQRVDSESTTWHVPKDAMMWHRPNYHGYQTWWEHTKADAIRKDFNIQLNVTMELIDGSYAALLESGSFSFSGASLKCHKSNEMSTYFADNSEGWNIEGTVTTPWRIIMVADDLNTLVNANLPAAVCPAPDKELFPKGCHTEWIKPGKSLWQWWGYWNPGTLWERQRWFVDNAAALGCEYYLVDEGWEHPAQGWVTENRTAWEALKELADYGKKRGVKLIVWRSYPSNKANYYEGMETKEKRIRFFENCQKAGVYGCKLDFLNNESVVHQTFMHECLKEAAQFKQVVNYHGCPKPMGTSRTYPNEVTREGVIGMEHNKWETIPRYHYATAPFTRFLSGYADFTVTTFQPDFLKGTTSTLQLATAIAYTSPALHWADKPQFLLRSPSVDLLRSMPTTWDETVVLPCSEIGKLAAFARRKGQDWYVAYINGTDEKQAQPLNLDFLGNGKFSTQIYSDVTNDPVALGKVEMTLDSDQSLNVNMAPGGGYVAVFRKLDAAPYGGPVYSKTKVKLKFPPGAEVRYTTDGSEPTAESPLYLGTFQVRETCQLRAKVINGDGEGAEISAMFVKLPVPEPEVEDRHIVNHGDPLGIMGITNDSVLHYTLDGSEPTLNSPVCSGELKITKECVIKVAAVIDGLMSKVVTHEVSVIPPQPPVPSVNISDLKPLHASIGWGKIQHNKNISGKTLKIAGNSYTKGIGTHSTSKLRYQLKPHYKRFVATAGVDDSNKHGSVQFIVLIDGKQQQVTPVLNKGVAWHFNVPIPATAKEIELVVNDGGDGIDNDHANWVNAGFTTY